jgi:hypothetical protein
LAGWLGDYTDAEDFIHTHYNAEVVNPCHMTVDYDDPNWKDKLNERRACRGQAQMFVNACKLPREGELKALVKDAERDDDVFTWRHDFIEHHSRRRKP